MSDKSYSTSITVDQTPEAVFAAINNVNVWWPDCEGESDKLGATFTHSYGNEHRCTIKITEFVPGQKVVWHVVDNYFSFVADKTEWKDTDIVFDIAKKGDKTELTFTHEGLVPAYECYNLCSGAWESLINEDLPELIEASGK